MKIPLAYEVVREEGPFRFRLPDEPVTLIEEDGFYFVLTPWKERIKIVDPKPGRSVIIRLFAKVLKTDMDCWEWSSGVKKSRYPKIRYKGKRVGIHIASYVLFRGEYPDHLLVCHTCDNNRCCNPSHLFLGTDKDNAEDRDKKGRNGSEKRQGEKNSRSKLTEKDVLRARRLKRMGMNYSDIASIFGVHSFTITLAIKGHTWKYL